MTRGAATRIGLRSRRVQLQLTESNWIGNQAPAEPTVDICNSISRNNKFGLVEEYIAEFEGARKDYESTSSLTSDKRCDENRLDEDTF